MLPFEQHHERRLAAGSRSSGRRNLRHSLLFAVPALAGFGVFMVSYRWLLDDTISARPWKFAPQWDASLASKDVQKGLIRIPPEISQNSINMSVPYFVTSRVLNVAPIAPAAPQPINFSKEMTSELKWTYLADEKMLPYVGDSKGRTAKYGDNHSHALFNQIAVFHSASDKPSPVDGITRMHGWLGVDREGRSLWQPIPTPPLIADAPGGAEAMLKYGGFYVNLSSSLPLDREVPDFRDPVCKTQTFDLDALPDASIVITFYNEPLSTLLRSVHSVLNRTPPQILREIILVDDHSDLPENLPGSPLYEYVKYLPKTKIHRLGARRGLVHARLAGAKMATGKVLVVLDSHIEVNVGWLEPQLARIAESPNSVVFPQILAINPETFEYDKNSGIGCKLSFRWSMVEQATLTATVTDPSPIQSPSMAGGLFAVDLDYFWHIGGYDEGFSMWGAENVEMGFRVWLCGGKLECVPCAKTFHIYRKKGAGYESPHDHIVRNRLRTARVWTDDYFAIAKLFIQGKNPPEMGSLDKMLELKRRLRCRKFQYFLDKIDSKHDIQNIHSIEYHGEVRSKRPGRLNFCLDTMSKLSAGEEFGVFPCHGEGGTQSWIYLREKHTILPVASERLCLSTTAKFEWCHEYNPDTATWILAPIDVGNNIVQIQSEKGYLCLSNPAAGSEVSFQACNAKDRAQHWTFKPHVPTKVEPLDFSDEWKAQKKAWVPREDDDYASEDWNLIY